MDEIGSLWDFGQFSVRFGTPQKTLHNRPPYNLASYFGEPPEPAELILSFTSNRHEAAPSNRSFDHSTSQHITA